MDEMELQNLKEYMCSEIHEAINDEEICLDISTWNRCLLLQRFLKVIDYWDDECQY